MSLNKLLDPVRISNIDDTIVSEMCNAGFSVDQDKPGVFDRKDTRATPKWTPTDWLGKQVFGQT